MNAQLLKIIGIALIVLGVGMVVYNGALLLKLPYWSDATFLGLAVGAMLIAGGIFAYKEGSRAQQSN